MYLKLPGFWYTFKLSYIFVMIQTDLVKRSSEVELHFLYSVGQLLLQLQEKNDHLKRISIQVHLYY